MPARRTPRPVAARTVPRAARPQARPPAPGRFVVATVASVADGAAADGTALITVDWDGAQIQAARLDSYTPAAGHRVLCAYQDSQLVILGRVVGQP